MLKHLANSSGGLEATNIIGLQALMLGWWSEDPRVPKFINRLEDVQKKSLRTKLPITDA